MKGEVFTASQKKGSFERDGKIAYHFVARVVGLGFDMAEKHRLLNHQPSSHACLLHCVFAQRTAVQAMTLGYTVSIKVCSTRLKVRVPMKTTTSMKTKL